MHDGKGVLYNDHLFEMPSNLLACSRCGAGHWQLDFCNLADEREHSMLKRVPALLKAD
jgi:hypothetical protein